MSEGGEVHIDGYASGSSLTGEITGSGWRPFSPIGWLQSGRREQHDPLTASASSCAFVVGHVAKRSAPSGPGHPGKAKEYQTRTPLRSIRDCEHADEPDRFHDRVYVVGREVSEANGPPVLTGREVREISPPGGPSEIRGEEGQTDAQSTALLPLLHTHGIEGPGVFVSGISAQITGKIIVVTCLF